MIRFALIVASTLGFFLTAALGNLMTPLLRAFHDRQQPQKEAEPPTMGGLCLMTGTMAAVGVGWTAACVAQPELLGSENLLTTRLLIALFGALCFGGVGLADDLFAGVADAGHTGIAAQGAILPGLDAVQDGLAVVERVLIVADHRLFEAQMVEQPQRDAGVLSRDEVRQAEGSRHTRRHVIQIADRRGDKI